MEPTDLVVVGILGIALLRGFFRGLLREVFSIVALAGACVAVRLYVVPGADWLEAATQGEIGPALSPWVAGAGIGIGTIAAVVIAGRFLRRGARIAGLGWADRAGGALLGTAEGVLVVGVLLAIAMSVLGRSHPILAETRSLHAFEQLEEIAQTGTWRDIDVAAPPRSG